MGQQLTRSPNLIAVLLVLLMGCSTPRAEETHAADENSAIPLGWTELRGFPGQAIRTASVTAFGTEESGKRYYTLEWFTGLGLFEVKRIEVHCGAVKGERWIADSGSGTEGQWTPASDTTFQVAGAEREHRLRIESTCTAAREALP